MNNKTIVGIIVVALVVMGGYYAWSNSKDTSSEANTVGSMMAANSTPIVEKSTMMADQTAPSASGYVPYSQAALDAASNQRRVLFFYASWCPTCRPADADFSANAANLPADMTVIRVNYNDPDTDEDEKELAKLYGVTYQHTFVQIDSSGKALTKWNGGQFDQLLANTKEGLLRN